MKKILLSKKYIIFFILIFLVTLYLHQSDIIQYAVERQFKQANTEQISNEKEKEIDFKGDDSKEILIKSLKNHEFRI